MAMMMTLRTKHRYLQIRNLKNQVWQEKAIKANISSNNLHNFLFYLFIFFVECDKLSTSIKQPLRSQVVGGKNATAGEFPHMVT